MNSHPSEHGESAALHAQQTWSPWYLRYVMLMAFLIVTVSLMDRYVVSILMEQIKADLSLTDTQLGWLVGPAFVTVHILCQLPLARIADRSSRTTMIALAMVLWSFFTIAAGFTKTFVQLFITRMGVGITEAASGPPLAALLSDYFGPKNRGLAMAMLPIGGTAGIGAGMLVGGIVGQEYGWRTALIVAGIPGVILALIMWLTIKEPRRGSYDSESGTSQQPPFFETFRILAANRSYCWLIVGASLAMLNGLGRGSWEPVFLMRVYELSQAKAGMIFFIITPLPAIVGGICGGLLLDRLCRRDARWYMWLPAAAILISLPLLVAFLLWPEDHKVGGIPIGLILSFVGSVIGGAAAPAFIATGQSLVNSSMRATSHAVWSMVANLIGMGIGPLLAGWLSTQFAPAYGHESIRYALVLVTLVGLFAGIALLIGARHIRNDLQK